MQKVEFSTAKLTLVALYRTHETLIFHFSPIAMLMASLAR